MGQKVKEYNTDVVIAGSGPGGATVARELSKLGKRVVLCELGTYQKQLGRCYSVALMSANKSLTFSKEGLLVVIPETVGGASMMYCGTAIKPPAWLKEKYGIDIDAEVDELYEEIPIRPLADHLLNPGVKLISKCATDIGLDWKPLDKYIRSDKCDADGKCMLGCKVGAKFTAREYVDEAVINGATLLTSTKVDKVLTENGRAVGVRAITKKGKGDVINIMAEKVVLSGGGRGTPLILKHSGIYDAGIGFFVDPVTSVNGIHPKYDTLTAIPMTAGTIMEDDGIVMTDASCAFFSHLALLTYSAPRGLLYLGKGAMKYKRTLSIMVKMRDDLGGWINFDGSFSKPISPEVWKSTNKGILLAEEILLKAGVKRKDIFSYRLLGAHPGGTIRIGNLLDINCETQIKNCYCMDTSVIPQPWGVPPTLLLFAMGKRLAKHIAGVKKTEKKK